MIIMTDMDKAELKKALGVDKLEERVKALEDAPAAQSAASNSSQT